jgi:hypothetical protein
MLEVQPVSKLREHFLLRRSYQNKDIMYALEYTNKSGNFTKWHQQNEYVHKTRRRESIPPQTKWLTNKVKELSLPHFNRREQKNGTNYSTGIQTPFYILSATFRRAIFMRS